MYNILITGSNGQVGSELRYIGKNYENYNFFKTTRVDLDIQSIKVIFDFVKKNSITHIINCAAYTKVDDAESNVEEAFSVNHKGVENLAKVSEELNITLIHISTDYVYDGKDCIYYKETNSTNPISVYGSSKLEGEKSIFNANLKNSIIIRTSWVYSSFGKNFLKTMINLASSKEEIYVVHDQLGTPTYARDLATVILNILPTIKNDSPQIFHYTNEGVSSWYDFAYEIFSNIETECIINPVKSNYYKSKATRPKNCLLDKEKIKDTFDISIPHWKDSLQNCVGEMKNHSIKNSLNRS